MKKILTVILTLSMIFALAACGSSGEPKEEKKVSCEITNSAAKVYKNSIDTGYVMIVVEVTNTGNTNLYLDTASIDIENDEGDLVDTFEMVHAYPNTIAPGEKAYYFEETLCEAKTGDYEAIANFDYEEYTSDIVRFEVSEDKLRENYGTAELIGRIENATSEDAEFVYVAAVAFNKDGNPIGGGFTIVDSLKAGKKSGFKLNMEGLSKKDVDHYEVYAYEEVTIL